MKKIIIIALLFAFTSVSYSQMGMMMGKSKNKSTFISTWLTRFSNETITLPLLSSGGQYDFTVDWGDGTVEQITSNSASHTYAAADTQTITISGLINGWSFNNTGSRDKILDISQWGCLKGAGIAAFSGCLNLNVSATDPLDTRGITNFTYQFYNCISLTTIDVSKWDVSSVTNFSNQFTECYSLINLDVSDWDVSSGTNFSYQFHGCISLTSLDVSDWDVSGGNYFTGQFYNCYNLTTLDVSDWDVTNGLEFFSFMYGVTMTTPTYNQTLINWKDKLQTGSFDIHFGSSKYNLAPNPAAAARADIEALGWTIIDGGGI